MNKNTIPVYIINMKDSKTRMQRVREQLEELAIPYTRIDAVVGRELTEAEINACYDPILNKQLHHRNLTVGEIGCYLSHRKVFTMMVEQGIEKSLILEDDIVIKQHLQECIDIAQQSSGWDVIKIADDEDVTPAASKELSEQVNLISYNRVPNRTMGYFISLEAAKKMLSRDRFYRPVDVDFQFYRDFDITICGLTPNAIEVCPQLGVDENSDIAKQNRGAHSNHSTFLRNLKYRWALKQRRKSVSYDIQQFQIEK